MAPPRKQPQQPPPEQKPKKQPGTGAATAPAVVPVVAVVAPAVVGAISAAAIAAAVVAILKRLDVFHKKRRKADATWLRTRIAREYPQRTTAEIDEIVRLENSFQLTFERRMRDRLQRDLPKALALADPQARQQAVDKILARERRYVEMRQKAMAARSMAAAELFDVKAASPDGAYWKLDPTAKVHTIDCVVGSALLGGPEALGAARRPYTGKLVEIVVASGEVLPVTPNHPLLTSRGWFAAKELCTGDYLMRDDGFERDDIGPPENNDDVPASLSDVFETFQKAESSLAIRDRVGPLDFHGDVPVESEVDVVGAYGTLRYGRRVALLRQPAANESLFSRDPAVAISLSSQGVRVEPIVGELASSACQAPAAVGVVESPAILGGHRGDGESHGLGSLPDCDPRFEKSRLERLACDSQLVGESLDGLSGLVTEDEIVEIREIDFSGHVYNVETVGGWYTANGLIVANCLLMGEKYWPWEVLDLYHPLLHVGCLCHLKTRREAEEAGLMVPGQGINVADAIRTAHSVMARFEQINEAAWPEEVEAFVAETLLEAELGHFDYGVPELVSQLADNAIAWKPVVSALMVEHGYELGESRADLLLLEKEGSYAIRVQLADGLVADVLVEGRATAPQKCKYCDEPATKSVVHAEGAAYVPVCDAHEARARKRIGESDVSRVIEIQESKITYEAETELIRANAKKPEAGRVHKFKAAEWTHKNGHPRCLICGDEEPIGGKCNHTPTKAEQDAFARELEAEFAKKDLQEAPWSKRFPKGDPHGGQFMPKGGIAHIRAPIRKALKALVPKLPEGGTGSPGGRRSAVPGPAQGRWAWIRGNYVLVPRSRDWSRHYGDANFTSPASSTNIYKDGKLIHVEGSEPEHPDLQPPKAPEPDESPSTVVEGTPLKKGTGRKSPVKGKATGWKKRVQGLQAQPTVKQDAITREYQAEKKRVQAEGQDLASGTSEEFRRA